jgi:glycosyltransferase involved in cell wall biosynthesis
MLACSLAKKGITIDFFVYYPENDFYADRLKQNKINIYSSTKKSRFDISPIFSLRKLINKNNYHAALSYLNTPNFYAEVATLLTLGKTPLYISERSCYLDNSTPKVMTQIRENFHRIAKLVICNSFNQRQLMLDRYPWLKDKVVTILNGVNTLEFIPSNIPVENNKLLVVSRVDKGKNALNLAKALKIFRDKQGWCPDLTWAGKPDPTLESKVYINKVNDFLLKNTLTQHWTWAGECSNIIDMMQKHKALIHPSFYEGFPNAVCEALSVGLPVVVSDVCDNSLLVDEGKNGMLFNPNDVEDIAKALINFFDLSDTEVENFRINGRKFAEDKLSIEECSHQYQKIMS